MTLNERIERLRAHLTRKPQDRQARDKLFALVDTRGRGLSFDAFLRVMYPADSLP